MAFPQPRALTPRLGWIGRAFWAIVDGAMGAFGGAALGVTSAAIYNVYAISIGLLGLSFPWVAGIWVGLMGLVHVIAMMKGAGLNAILATFIPMAGVGVLLAAGLPVAPVVVGLIASCALGLAAYSGYARFVGEPETLDPQEAATALQRVSADEEGEYGEICRRIQTLEERRGNRPATPEETFIDRIPEAIQTAMEAPMQRLEQATRRAQELRNIQKQPAVLTADQRAELTACEQHIRQISADPLYFILQDVQLYLDLYRYKQVLATCQANGKNVAALINTNQQWLTSTAHYIAMALEIEDPAPGTDPSAEAYQQFLAAGVGSADERLRKITEKRQHIIDATQKAEQDVDAAQAQVRARQFMPAHAAGRGRGRGGHAAQPLPVQQPGRRSPNPHNL